VLSFNTHLIWSQTPHLSTCTLLVFSYISEQGKSYQGEHGSLEERILGMNNTMSSSKALLSYHYSSAYELDYSFHVIILTYELAYSLYVMILTCSTLCLTIHMTYMSRSRARLRWQFIIPSGVPMFYACRSVGLKSRGDVGSLCVIGHFARVHGNRGIHFLLSS
jgi:hypothetical protein